MEFASTAAPLLDEMPFAAAEAPPAAAADPYCGVALGVECAWPASDGTAGLLP